MAQQRGKVVLAHISTAPEALYCFLCGQARYMASRGLQVHGVCSGGELLDQFCEREGARGHVVDMAREIEPIRDLGALVRMIRTLRSLRPDVVHTHTAKAGLLGMVAAWLLRVPVRVHHIHGLRFVTLRGLRRRIVSLCEKLPCLLAHQVLCVSHSGRQVAIDHGLCPPDKVKVLLGGSINGVDALGRFNPDSMPAGTREATRDKHGIPADARVIGFVGRLVRDKGIAELTAAWQSLRERFPTSHLLLVGPFEEGDAVPTDIREALQADDRVHPIGQDYDTPALYLAMDVLALPTYREGLPLVPLEASAMGLAVVATRVPGCVDVVRDKVTGALVPPGDSEALCEAIAMYLDAPALGAAHGRAGRERMLAQFGQEAIWQATYDEYARLLKGRGLPAPDSAPQAEGTPAAEPGRE